MILWRIFRWALALAVISSLCWYLFQCGRSIPYAEQWAICDGLRQTAAIVFGVMGAWIAIVYPSAISKLLKREAIGDGVKQKAFQRILKPLLLSTTIVCAVLIASVAAPIVRRNTFLIGHKEIVRGVSFAIIGLLMISELFAVVFTLIPLDSGKTEIDRMTEQNQLRKNIRPVTAEELAKRRKS